MADRCCQYTYAGITVNGALTTNTLLITDDASTGWTGLDGAPIRRQVDPLGLVDGGDSQPAWRGARVITGNFVVFVGTHASHDPYTDKTDYLSKLITYQKAIISALEAQLNSASNLTWTDSAGAGRSISCLYGTEGGEVQFGGTFEEPTCTFTLLAENPTIS